MSKDARVEAELPTAALDASRPVEDAGLDAEERAADELDATVDGGDAAADAAVDAGVDAGPPLGYAKDVAPIFARHCVSCHGPSGVGPFPLDNFDDASSYGPAAYGAASTRFMPPCAQVDPSCEVPRDELTILQRWLLQGRPRGD